MLRKSAVSTLLPENVRMELIRAAGDDPAILNKAIANAKASCPECFRDEALGRKPGRARPECKPTEAVSP